MATSLQNSTPPPPSSSVHTPPAPQFGYDDSYEPYTPRKSARVSQRSREAKTPPPSSHKPRHSHPSQSKPARMSPSSPQTASKKRTPVNPMSQMGGRRVSGALTFDATATAASSLGLPPPKNTAMERQQAAARANGMLPTPAKTPQKRPEEVAPAVTSIARNLFSVRPGLDEVMPSPKKKGRKNYTGLTLDSFQAEERSIEIYTDSHDRVPEVDLSPENPFYGPSSKVVPEPTKRSSKRRKVTVEGEGERSVEELVGREDGYLYTFRGKKFFQKLADVDDDAGQSASEGFSGNEVDAGRRRPFTRSSIKPRLLFPSKSKGKETQTHTTTDEEADTDIEDHNMSTPFGRIDEIAATPKAPKFAPSTPPTTIRATRSKKVELISSPDDIMSEDDDDTDTSPVARSDGTKVSPFDSWQRVKGSPVGRGSRKRSPADSMITRGTRAKRAKH